MLSTCTELTPFSWFVQIEVAFCAFNTLRPHFLPGVPRKSALYWETSIHLKAIERLDRSLISICQNKENYGTNILVYLKAMRKFFDKIFFRAKKIDLPGSYTFSQNITKFGKSGFLKRKKKFVKKFSHSFQIYQNVILFILTYWY